MTAIVQPKYGLKLPLFEVNIQDKIMVKMHKAFLFFTIISLIGVLFAYIYGMGEIHALRGDVELMKEALEILKLAKDNDIILNDQFNLFAPFFDDGEEYEEDDGNGFDYEDENRSGTTSNSFELGSTLRKEVEENVKGVGESTLSPLKLTKDFKHKTYRAKRTVLAETMDGVEINEEPYSEIQHENKTTFHSPAYVSTNPAFKHYEEGTTPTTSPILARKSRVMHSDDNAKANRKPKVKSLEQKDSQEEITEAEIASHKVRHRHQTHPRHKQRMVETLDDTAPVTILRPAKRTIAAHFNGDTGKYVLGQHSNYNGNGHVRHPSKIYVDWKATDWMKTLNMDQFFQMNEGVLTIKEAGIYLVYAQIYYLDAHDMNGYRVYRNGQTILQCTTMTHSKEKIMKGNTCYTAAVEYLMEGDRVTIRDLSEGRYSLFENGKSFIGVIKMGDARNK